MTGLNSRLLIVDKDTTLLASLADDFAPYGFAIDPAPTAPLMREHLAREEYDLVILDTLAVPDEAPALLRELAIERRLPVIIHSTACSEPERIAALEMGAEDCLCKPANPRELLARIRAALRGRKGAAPRMETPARAFASFEGWRVDLTTGQLFNPVGAPISLSDGEFQLLRVFVQHPRKVLDRAVLLDRVYGSASEHFDRSIDVQLCRLRRKLSASGLKGPVIRTIRNEGYMFVHSVTA
ncbi:two-component system, OmpR family, response regulator [Sphingobium sp. AP50]|uniref:winged helix-turn-helix domain-containing protein n=1 Tax=Sphingobium sp. AP50 TaxID=1884369 RepID=UPI0008B3E9F7|nr:response regulator transcription factor [Sphingobium sp. AP50]SEI97858.1 two-component system, OmpR family, response regulator [Sphingobium sp. AP50]